MSFFRHIGLDAARFQFDVFVHTADNIPASNASSDQSLFYATCERGKKKFRTESHSKLEGAAIRFDEVLTFTCTLYRAPNSALYAKKGAPALAPSISSRRPLAAVFTFRVKSVEKIKRFGRSTKRLNLFASVNLSGLLGCLSCN